LGLCRPLRFGVLSGPAYLMRIRARETVSVIPTALGQWERPEAGRPMTIREVG